MPTIRDGRGVLTVHDMSTPPAGSALAPVERSQASAQRMADFAAERAAAAHHDRVSVDPTPKKSTAEYMAASRARGAVRGGFVKGQKKPVPPASPEPQPEPVEAAIDVQLVPGRSKRLGVAPGYKRSPETRERMRQGQLAHHARIRAQLDGSPIDPAGKTAAEVRREAAAAAEAPRERPTADRPADPEVDVASGGAAPAPAEVGASAAAEAPSAVVPGLPCDSCSHAAVCVIRPELEAWVATLPRPVSQLAAITVVEARLELACSHYLLAVPA